METMWLISLVLVVGASAGSENARWTQFFMCVTSDLGAWSLLDKHVLCAAFKSFYHYANMEMLQCSNCDKYFHCVTNLDVVRTCGDRETTTHVMIALRYT